MKIQASKATAFLMSAALALAACGTPTELDPTEQPDLEEPRDSVPSGWPLVPRPAHAHDFDVPDQSDTLVVLSALEGKDVDFAPVWSEGMFTWDIDIQTTYVTCKILAPNDCDRYGETPGHYADGAMHSSALLFENGAVDLRTPDPYHYVENPSLVPRQVMFIEGGVVLSTPRNPNRTSCKNYWWSETEGGSVGSIGTVTPCLFHGFETVAVQPGFREQSRQREYHVMAVAAPRLADERVFLKRERYWERVRVDNQKTVTAEPGFSKSVEYKRIIGTSITASTSFAETIDAELSAGAPSEVIGASLGYSVTETFSASREVTEVVEKTVTHHLTGLEGKTVMFSVWQSVERYTFVDADGNAFTDASYTFVDLGDMVVRGDHEILQSAIFDYP